jgi:hypothetical protein
LSDLTSGSVEAELVFEPVNFGQRLLTSGAQSDWILARQNQLEAGRHGVTSQGNGMHRGTNSFNFENPTINLILVRGGWPLDKFQSGSR